MKPMAILGLILIVLGILAFGYQGVLWVSSTEQVAKIGPVEVNRQKETPVPLAPILGGTALVAGLGLLVASGRQTAV